MTPVQRYWWRIALELKLRKCNGDAFQDFFSSVMGKVHGTDFVRVRPYGRRGDKGCDGYLKSSGQVFQCYGALNSDGSKVDYLIGKMDEDFSKANKSLTSIMKEWHMVHNLVEGLPVDAIEELKKLEDANAGYKFGFIGLEGFEERIFSLDPADIEDLLGIAATNRDAQNLQIEELRGLIADVATAAEEVPIDMGKIQPVPLDKLELNKLPGHWYSLIAGGWQNAHHVTAYLDDHYDPQTGERIAQEFRVHYQYLKSQHLRPGQIMSSLYERVTGIGSVPPARQVAAQALLAYLFEKCDIFEDDPNKVTW